MKNEEKSSGAVKRDRYWSVMLVGDHGRVIPFRHFKGFAIGVVVALLLSLTAFIVMVVLYSMQGQKLEQLDSRLKAAQLQNSKLRDEKDLYLTKLMMKQQARENSVKKEVSQTESKVVASSAQSVVDNKPAAAAPKKETQVEKPAKPETPPPKVDWNADIRSFSVDYDAQHEVLKAQFRIYNTSKPKKQLTGRTVVVFKVTDDPPIKWLTVPHVQLRDGKPLGGRGKVFRINNYRTMQFKAYRQKAPVNYNAVTAFVFSSEGRVLASKDFSFKIDFKPPVKKEPAKEKVGQQTPVKAPKAPAAEAAPMPAGETRKDNVVPTAPARESVPSTTQPITRKPTVEGPSAVAPSEQKTIDEPSGIQQAQEPPRPESNTPAAPSDTIKPEDSPDSPEATSPSQTEPKPQMQGEQP